LAQCEAGFSGSVTVLAGTLASSMGMPDTGSQLKIFGTAKLVCP
jgi:hypothetical protein